MKDCMSFPKVDKNRHEPERQPRRGQIGGGYRDKCCLKTCEEDLKYMTDIETFLCIKSNNEGYQIGQGKTKKVKALAQNLAKGQKRSFCKELATGGKQTKETANKETSHENASSLTRETVNFVSFGRGCQKTYFQKVYVVIIWNKIVYLAVIHGSALIPEDNIKDRMSLQNPTDPQISSCGQT